VSDYVTKSGIRLEKNPIVPDIEITERPEAGKDPALDKALEKLRAAASLWRLPWAA
jgi:C-terminal processing protease CtpA/Prc